MSSDETGLEEYRTHTLERCDSGPHSRPIMAMATLPSLSLSAVTATSLRECVPALRSGRE